MKLVASIITVKTRDEFYAWLESLPWNITIKEKLYLAEKAKVSKTALWSFQTGFVFW